MVLNFVKTPLVKNCHITILFLIHLSDPVILLCPFYYADYSTYFIDYTSRLTNCIYTTLYEMLFKLLERLVPVKYLEELLESIQKRYEVVIAANRMHTQY